MAIVKKISVDNLSGSPEERDIGAEAQNVSYSEEESVKDKLDQHETHVDSSVVSEDGVHGLRIHDDILQSYDETEEDWVPVSTGYDVPAGGATNQGLVKASAEDNDTTWTDVLLKNGSVAADNITVGSRRSDVTTGLESLTMGPNNAAAGRGAQAQGASNNASGNYSHAEGQSSSASGVAAHAEGNYTVATGNASHAEGDHTEAGYAGQHVTGKYNDNKEDTLFEVGNGTLDNARSNAFEVTNDGYIRTYGNNVKIAFGVDGNGKYGYIKENDSNVTPFGNEIIPSGISGQILRYNSFNKLQAENVTTSATSGSSSLITSGGVYSALSGKQDILTFDNTPISGSSNPVKSGGIYTSINTLDIKLSNLLNQINGDLTTSGLGFHNCVYKRGGYKKIGDKMIYINLQIQISQAFSGWATLVSASGSAYMENLSMPDIWIPVVGLIYPTSYSRIFSIQSNAWYLKEANENEIIWINGLFQ